MSYDAECPYCGAEVEICHDDGYGYDEDEVYEQECGNCEMVFAYTTETSYYYSTRKADCLNGGQHQWNPVRMYPRVYPDAKQCEGCGERVNGDFDREAFERSIEVA